MTRRQKKNLRRILLAAALAVAVVLIPAEALPTVWGGESERGLLRLLLFLVPYLIVGWDVLLSAVRNLFRGQLLDEKFLMAISTVGAFALGEFTEGVAVMLLYQVGELFQGIAVGKSRRHIASLMDIRPDTACVLRDGEDVIVSPDEVAVGETIRILAGEKVPLDGVVLSGESSLNTAALTGESLPQHVASGDRVVSGAVNLGGELLVRVESVYAESTVSRILELVENASEKKARVENFITRFAHWYTPVVVGVAVLLGIIPPIFDGNWADWIGRALIFLVVSCPCALVISVPLSFFGGIGGASRRGILIKGAGYMEVLARAHTVVFDKTGTLTHGNFRVTDVSAADGDAPALLALAAAVEAHSNHPIARSVCEACQKTTLFSAEDVCEIAGQGMSAGLNGRRILVGNHRLMEENGISYIPHSGVGTVLYVAADATFLGSILLSDEIKPEAREAVAQLKSCGVRRTVMLTGDRVEIGEAVVREIGVDEAHCGLLPEDKVAKTEEMLTKTPGLVYVGDGINDAPVLSRADVGVAMGALGSDAAIEAADIVLMEDRLSKLPEAIRLSRRTMRIVRQNIVFALGVKGLALLLGALGYANMWGAIFADVGVMVLAILNAMRTMYIGKGKG
ncbi:MAG: cadmium-translocating P-type ATPase [Clostridia bacterium]|nr:cadmium-translocating P-type ATPase [Clostridia bacterium]